MVEKNERIDEKNKRMKGGRKYFKSISMEGRKEKERTKTERRKGILRNK